MSRIDDAIEIVKSWCHEDNNGNLIFDTDYGDKVINEIKELKKHKKNKKKKCVWIKEYNDLGVKIYSDKHLAAANMVVDVYWKYCPYCGRKIKFKESD